VPDPEKLLENYIIVYEQGIAGWTQQSKAEIFWFTCKVMLTVEKWKPYNECGPGRIKLYFSV